MANLNRVLLIGNLTRDPDVKYTPKGTAVAKLGLAVNRSYTNDAGEKIEEATFVDVELWGRTAEIAGEYLRKGRQCFIEGRLRLDQWEDKTNGQKRSRMVVVGETLQLLGGREGGGGGGAGGGGDYEGGGGGSGGGYSAPAPSGGLRRPAPSRPAAPPKPAPDPDLDAESDDIPF